MRKLIDDTGDNLKKSKSCSIQIKKQNRTVSTIEEGFSSVVLALVASTGGTVSSVAGGISFLSAPSLLTLSLVSTGASVLI